LTLTRFDRIAEPGMIVRPRILAIAVAFLEGGPFGCVCRPDSGIDRVARILVKLRLGINDLDCIKNLSCTSDRWSLGPAKLQLSPNFVNDFLESPATRRNTLLKQGLAAEFDTTFRHGQAEGLDFFVGHLGIPF
jgi:hypothetical protein